jgi:hypothetical protein
MAEPNGGWPATSRWRYPPRHWGDSDGKMEASAGVFLFIVRGERERECSRSRTSATADRRLASPVGTRRSVAPLSWVRLARGTVGLKPAWATIPPGRFQIIKPNVFFLFSELT